MECTPCDCPYPQCTHDGKRGFNAPLVRCGADRGIPRLLCSKCQGTCSVRQGTAYFGVRAEEPHDTMAMRALAEGHALRGTGRIIKVDTDTVCGWLDRAGRPGRAVTAWLFDTLPSTACQVDALWRFVRKKEAHRTVAEQVLALSGDAWVWMAFAPGWRLVATFVVGTRAQESANVLRERLQAVRGGSMPCFTSDQWPHSPQALVPVSGTPESILHRPGKRGPTPTPKRLPPADLHDAQVVKRRQSGRVGEGTTRSICGSEAAVQTRWAASVVSQTIHTSVVERNTLPCRQCHGRLSRKVLSFSTDLTG
jgi:IS1 family transposase